MKRLAILVLAFPLAACEWQTTKGSIAGGESKVFEAPEYVVRGVKPYDQNWIDSNIEAGIGGFGWKRPKPRPDWMDAPGTKNAPPPPKKLSFVGRIKAKVNKIKAKVTRSPKVVAPIPYINVTPTFAPPSPPRDPVDLLLRP